MNELTHDDGTCNMEHMNFQSHLALVPQLVIVWFMYFIKKQEICCAENICYILCINKNYYLSMLPVSFEFYREQIEHSRWFCSSCNRLFLPINHLSVTVILFSFFFVQYTSIGMGIGTGCDIKINKNNCFVSANGRRVPFRWIDYDVIK